ncbi:glycosyltransferase family 4 protein [Pontibacter virosus]|uniref:Glycosyltransferase involved in cell wall biosynthesis n=1 Tax=Pontibacter virosus TaxID=1765052 RepID=A0A2U1B2W7_9BACT|nr:glycosyltransferase family 4 protein [Pontibacter virosus]PVY43024.1 glycosyltransferase involved in cell wall biosynthesis [Pontibacter virosus]
MKILQLVTKRQFRGAEVFAANLSKELLKENIEIVFAGLYSPPQHALTVEGARNIDLNGVRSKLISWSLLQGLKNLIEQEKPDVIQANGSDTLKYAAVLKLLKPTIPITYRNISIISNWIGGSIPKLYFYKKLFSSIDHVTCVGDVARQNFINTIGFTSDRVTVINRGIPMHTVNRSVARVELREKFSLDEGHKIVVHVGNFSPEKNHTFLLDVFEQIKETDNSIKLLLLGEGMLMQEIKSKVEAKGLADTVFFGGFTNQVQDIIAGCDLFALSSKIEGVPGVILEAAAQKIPAIAVDVGGVKEVVKHNQTGVLIPTHDPNRFAEELLLLLQDDQKRTELAQNAYHMVESDYDPLVNLHKFINLYKEMLAKNGR